MPTLAVVSSVKFYVEKRHEIKFKRVVFCLCFACLSISCKHLCFIDLLVRSFVVSILIQIVQLFRSVRLYVEKRHEIKFKTTLFSFDFLDAQSRENIFRLIDLSEFLFPFVSRGRFQLYLNMFKYPSVDEDLCTF